jgi:hypothetical protein
MTGKNSGRPKGNATKAQPLLMMMHALHHHTITPLQTPRTVTHETCREGRHPPRAARKPRALSTSATAQALEAGALPIADDGHDVGGALVARPARHRANELDRGF